MQIASTFSTSTMQSPSSSAEQPEFWNGFRRKWAAGHSAHSHLQLRPQTSVPTDNSLHKICGGNMIPVWSFLLKRVKSEKTAENSRRIILVHGADDGGKGRRKGKLGVVKEESISSSSSSSSSSREKALQERELAEKEVVRLMQIGRRQLKELKARMIEVEGGS